MPAFDAGSIAEALDWDFTGRNPQTGQVPANWPRSLANVSGTVPEPSDKEIGNFLDGLKQVYMEAREKLPDLGPDPTADQMLEAVTSVTGQDFVKMMADVAGLFAKLCSNQPSKAQLLTLPLRFRVHFYAWIQGEVVNPEVETGAGTAAVKPLRPAAAG